MYGESTDATFLDADLQDWVFDTWTWLMSEFGGMARIRWTKLALPTTDFFPRTTTQGHDRAVYLLERVKILMDMADWSCVLEPSFIPLAEDQAVPDEEAPSDDTAEDDSGGGDEADEGKKDKASVDEPFVIGYGPNLLANPSALIAKLALCRLSRSQSDVPGDDDELGAVAELTLVFFGMGVFGANTACEYEAQMSVRYRSHSITPTYLSEPTWAFANTLLCALKDVEPPFSHLQSSMAELTNDAVKYLQRNEALLEPLRKIAS